MPSSIVAAALITLAAIAYHAGRRAATADLNDLLTHEWYAGKAGIL